MSYTKTPEQVISMWITNVRRKLENDDIESALTFLGILECDWKKYQHGELEPITIHTGNKMLIEHFGSRGCNLT